MHKCAPRAELRPRRYADKYRAPALRRRQYPVRHDVVQPLREPVDVLSIVPRRRWCNLPKRADMDIPRGIPAASLPPGAIDRAGPLDPSQDWVDEDGTPDSGTLTEIVRRLVRAVAPDRIILFGSGARGKMTAESDLDLLIVKAGCNTRRLAAEARCSLGSDGPPVDVIAATPEHIRKHADSLSLVFAPATREGVTLYDKTRAVDIPEAVRRGVAINKTPKNAAVMVQKRIYKPEEALQWLDKARSELAHSQTSDPRVNLTSKCINAQAAAESALKGIITAHGSAVHFIHKLAPLANQARSAGETLPSLDRKTLEYLSDYGGGAQYPGWPDEPTDQEFDDVQKLAGAIVEHAERRIPEILARRRPKL